MSTNIPLQQTLHLLDTKDRLREQATGMPTHDLLARHLMDISESQGSKMTQVEAEAVVSTALATPEAAALPVQLWDRPGSQDAWRLAQTEASACLDLSQQKYDSLCRKESPQLWGLFALFLGIGGVALGSAICLGGIAGMILGAAAFLFLSAGAPVGPSLIYAWAGFDARLKAAEIRCYQDQNVRLHLDEAPEPTLETLAAWAQVPGLSPMLHSIVASEVPFLRLDLEHIQARVSQHEKEQESKAEEERKRRLRQDSLDLLRNQMDGDPKD